MTDRTNAIKAAIDATTPAELQWLPNPGHEPAIPEGWKFAGVEYANGDRIMLDEAAEPSAWAWDFINHRSDLRRYAIRRKPTQPSQIDAINASVHACNTAFGACPEPQGVRAQPTLDQALEQLRIEAERLQQPSPTPTLSEVTPVTEDAHELRKRAVLLALNIFEPEPIRKQSGALVIAGRLTSVGERFAGIDSGDQQITLGINTEQARWLGRYVGGEVKLTVEVTP